MGTDRIRISVFAESRAFRANDRKKIDAGL